MKESHIATSGPKGFATCRSIWRKLTGSAPRGGAAKQEVLAALLTTLRKKREADGTTPEGVITKAKLAEFILPQVVVDSKDGDADPNVRFMEIDHKQAKLWAFACGEMIGMLAGLSIQKSVMAEAIDQVAEGAKDAANQIHEGLMKLSNLNGRPLKEDKPEPQKASDVNTTRKKMIEDLESQVMLEADPAAKAALQSMADRMKKEAELEDAA